MAREALCGVPWVLSCPGSCGIPVSRFLRLALTALTKTVHSPIEAESRPVCETHWSVSVGAGLEENRLRKNGAGPGEVAVQNKTQGTREIREDGQ